MNKNKEVMLRFCLVCTLSSTTLGLNSLFNHKNNYNEDKLIPIVQKKIEIFKFDNNNNYNTLMKKVELAKELAKEKEIYILEQNRIKEQPILQANRNVEISRGGSIKDLSTSKQVASEDGWFDVEVTFYTNDFHDCGKTDGITKSGKHVNSQTIATPSNIEFGTNIYIKGQGIKIAEDIGGAIQYVYHNGIRYMKIDVYIEGATQRELEKMGIIRTVAKIVNP